MMIDWNKPYGEICGRCGVPGAKYTQNDKFFTVKGEEIVPDIESEISKLKATGMTDTQIGEKLGITRQKVTKILCS